MNELTDLLHLILCQDQHLYDMMKLKDRHEGICYFYLEEQIASDKPMEDHVRWKEVTEKFKSSLNLQSDEEAIEFIKQCIKVSADLRELVYDNENRLNFIHRLLA